ncbi:hypothetical protein NDU88_006706 [Pleurodeles waltl]|uniref:Uncharacterized protein n=1 Tax=Pleurodeles waltl TaxID=8319 RepID=A0AAV7MD02_PLEWA|nr:hypothetical protein NDU88_006706 [Pleurodeles waltl]
MGRPDIRRSWGCIKNTQRQMRRESRAEGRADRGPAGARIEWTILGNRSFRHKGAKREPVSGFPSGTRNITEEGHMLCVCPKLELASLVSAGRPNKIKGEHSSHMLIEPSASCGVQRWASQSLTPAQASETIASATVIYALLEVRCTVDGLS